MQGLKGKEGFPGYPGVRGTPGAPGQHGNGDWLVNLLIEGETDDKGKMNYEDQTPGAQGTGGSPGENGPPGREGPMGPPGKPGTPGQDGMNGSVGSPGESGLYVLFCPCSKRKVNLSVNPVDAQTLEISHKRRPELSNTAQKSQCESFLT
ncbi:hypothetical protein KIN20_000565 [Parelaphostrongylus tenuis]|uniref:Collagen triple helix repeat protein n=1 Tax=Parelaphostrongylus tenuis TaxID=148309 RepID=A0AAD5QFN1_PARTN|nr:hypothetical protein KIN20_000565 [Parelaphostrongylus tenuis]